MQGIIFMIVLDVIVNKSELGKGQQRDRTERNKDFAWNATKELLIMENLKSLT